MDGDGRPEIAVVTTSGRVLLWSGGPVPGFPVQLGARARAGVSFGDVDGDGRPELLVGDERGKVHALKRNGREAPGWPATVGAPVTSTVSSSAFAGGRSFAVGCEDGKVHVLDTKGRERPGFPLVTRYSVTGAPAFADVDDDGELDLVVASQDFGVYAVDGKGAALAHFPVRAGYRLYEGVAVADVDGDRRPDLVFASADGMLHAVSGQGQPLPGFPVRAGGRIFSGPAVGDLDRDGRPDVVVVAADGTVTAVDGKGKALSGFPAHLGGNDVAASPLLHDATGDGGLDVFVGLPSGALHALRGASGSGRAAAAWAGPGRDAARTGRHGPNAPTFKDLALAPAELRARDVLRASWRAVWLDAGPGEAPPAPRLEWQRDGKPVPALEGRRELPPGTVRRGERWRFVLAGAGGARWESAEVRVLDTAPGAPALALEPPVPTRAAPVKVTVRTPAADPDGDALTYAFSWLLDGADTGVAGDTFPAALLRRGAILSARAVASDGELAGPPAFAQARVGDTAPGAPRVSLEPAAPGRADAVRVRIDGPAADIDGDALVYHHRWTVDGKAVNAPLAAAELPAGVARKHQKVGVEVRAFDGQLEGPPATASVVLVNTPPTAARVEIRPARPRKGDALRATVAEPAEDADADAVAYRFEWRKNGAPFGGAVADGREVPGAAVARGDRFELVVTPSDGEARGPQAFAAVTVVNTPPVPPRIAIEPARPRGGDALKVVVLDPARDPDGEPVTLRHAWSPEAPPAAPGAGPGAGAGRALPAAASFQPELAATAIRKHQRVKVVVTPRDGEEAGDPVTYEVMVEDAPPTAPGLAFSSDAPAVTAPLRAEIRTPSVDPDGDPVTYQYRWFRDGEPVPLPDGTEASHQAPFWTSTREVPRASLRKGQRWTVEARGFDGERYGPAARRTTTIVNSPPPAPSLAFSPARPRRVDGITVALEQPPDADGDVLTYRYAWTRDGQRFEAPPEQAQIPRGVPRKGQRWAVEVVASDGEADSPPVRHEVVVADTAPGPVTIAVCDGPVPAGTVPEARVTSPSADPDGDPITYRHEWTVNGKPVPGARGQPRLAAPALRKHDVARVVVTPWDGELAGPPAVGVCEVVNTPPSAPTVALEPAEPTAVRGVAVSIRKASADRDGDEITYRYTWFRDGVQTSHDKGRIPPEVLRHRETWRVEVTPYDGEDVGETAVASAVVRNTPPPAPSVVAVPPHPAAGDVVSCDARAPERDADQEAISLRYRWFRNDQPVAVGDGSAALPSRVVRRGERWRCEAWSFDGTDESRRVVAEVTVRNSPPTAPAVAVEPDPARRGDDLWCRVETPSSDLDDDFVSYAYTWMRNGRAVAPGSDPARIDGAKVAKGDRWRCTVTATDGTSAGPPGSVERVVSNTPPGAAAVRVVPTSPRAGEPLRCDVVSKAQDPDGDAVRYRYAWDRNGAAQPFAETSQEVPPRLVKAGDRWRCSVIPNDGSEDGPVASSDEVSIAPGVEERSPERGPVRSTSGRGGGRSLR
jgi:hypothetical protein